MKDQWLSKAEESRLERRVVEIPGEIREIEERIERLRSDTEKRILAGLWEIEEIRERIEKKVSIARANLKSLSVLA